MERKNIVSYFIFSEENYRFGLDEYKSSFYFNFLKIRLCALLPRTELFLYTYFL